jgi:HD-GYP domain-containing protein (c-di-GMP phosphodiesterase class II)
MAQPQTQNTEDTIELPKVSKDPAIFHLRQVEDEYLRLRKERDEQAALLKEARGKIRELQDFASTLERGLNTSEAENKLRAKELNKAHSELAEALKSVENMSEDLQSAQDQIEQERLNAERHRERAVQLAHSLKYIHRSLFEGGVYGLILKACLAITGATRGIYLTTRGEENTLSIRAAQDVDSYPGSPPSDFIKAICKSVLDENDTLVCNNEQEQLESLPRPERPGERFNNILAAPVVLLKSLNGIIIVADKLNGDFEKDDVETLLSVGDQAAVAVRNRHLHLELQNSYVATVSLLADAVEAKDPYTHGHCDLVSRYARLIADKLNITGQDLSVTCYSALLHDVGKIAVSDGLLNKPGPLLPEERELMRSHVRVGHDLLAKIPALGPVADVVLHHHEWYDGTGYPDGLKGAQIPLAARIVSVVDAFCAMITKRSYKDAYTVEHAKDELVRGSGTQFDPRVVKAFIEVLDSTEVENIDDEDYAICGVLPGFFAFETSA